MQIPSLSSVPQTVRTVEKSQGLLNLACEMAAAGMVGRMDLDASDSPAKTIERAWQSWQEDELTTISDRMSIVMSINEFDFDHGHSAVGDSENENFKLALILTSRAPYRLSVGEGVLSLNKAHANLGWYALATLVDALTPFDAVMPGNTYGMADWMIFQNEHFLDPDETVRMTSAQFFERIPKEAVDPGKLAKRCSIPKEVGSRSRVGRVAKIARAIKAQEKTLGHVCEKLRPDDPHQVSMVAPVVIGWTDDDPTQAITDDFFQMLWDSGDEARDWHAAWPIASLREVVVARERAKQTLSLLALGDQLLGELVKDRA